MSLTLEKVKSIAKKNKELSNFITKNSLSDELILANLPIIEEYNNSFELCSKKISNKQCLQKINGFRYSLVLTETNEIQLVLTECQHQLQNFIKQNLSDNFFIRDYDKKLLSLNFEREFFSTANSARQQIINYVEEKFFNLKDGNNFRGLFLFGDTGVGKTFTFILLANMLIAKNKTVCFIVWPDFVARIKNSFKSENESKLLLDQVKTCQFLFIDDLGGESISSWVRDNLLFPILNSRCLPLKTTFINSAFSIKFLSHYYLTNGDQGEKIKVNKIISRINAMTLPLHLTEWKGNQ